MQDLAMIILNITNASDLIASKVGKLAERITPDFIDKTMVEEKVAKKLVENLLAEGLKGEISLVNGLEVVNEKLVINEKFTVKDQQIF